MENQEQAPVRVRDEATIKLLAELKLKLYGNNISRARKAAHNLSWMQEDGFEILRDALFDQRAGNLKVAAAYGLRRMRGRMKAKAMDALREGLVSTHNVTRSVCKKTALLLNNQSKPKPARPPFRSYRSSASPMGIPRPQRPAVNGNVAAVKPLAVKTT
jgi:hypothetical protein